MNMITLQNSSPREVTILPNWFIDRYMSRANGEFVKIYIYLLRLMARSPVSFNLEEMADFLLCPERDILRALKYWEKEQLLSLSCDEQGRLSGILLCTPHDVPAAQAAASLQETAFTGSITPAAAASHSAAQKASDYPASAQQAASGLSDTVTPAVPDLSGAASSARQPARKPSLTPARVKELKENEEIIQLLYIAEQYLGKTLTPTEIQKILFFYDELKMSADLVEYLIEYCVGKNHKSMRYIETVALAWSDEGITTVEMAKAHSSQYNREYYTILKAMGISGRNPVETEVSLINTWLKDYGFSMELIQEACSRTVLQTGQPSFQYADKILSGWKEKNVHSMEDIRLLDAEHKKRKLEKETARPKTPKASNRFNNFHQRDYDFKEYEKQLLNK